MCYDFLLHKIYFNWALGVGVCQLYLFIKLFTNALI